MNKKYLIILIILAIITLGSVNAADNDENLTATTDNEIIAIEETQTTYDDVETQNILTANSNEENRISAGETGTFSELQAIINNANSGDTIELDKDYKYSPTSDSGSNYNDGIKIDIDGLTINGNNHIIDGDSSRRIFYITGDEVTIKNLIFVNGDSTNRGTSANTASGGAIFWNGDDGTVINSTFLNSNSGAYAGALYVYMNHPNFKLINSTFINNTAKNNEAGAVYIYIQVLILKL